MSGAKEETSGPSKQNTKHFYSHDVISTTVDEPERDPSSLRNTAQLPKQSPLSAEILYEYFERDRGIFNTYYTMCRAGIE